MLKLEYKEDFPSYNCLNNEVIPFEDTDCTVYRKVLDLHKKDFNKPCLRVHDDFTTYKELFEQTDHVADLLWSMGVHQNDTILMSTPSNSQATSILLACSKIGANAFILSYRTPEEHFEEYANKIESQILFCSESHYKDFAEYESIGVFSHIIVIPDDVAIGKEEPESDKFPSSSNIYSWNSFLEKVPNSKAIEVVGGNYTFAICSTTGSTNVPKAIRHLNRDLIASYISIKKLGLNFEPGAYFYTSLPLGMTTALNLNFALPLLVGAVRIYDLSLEGVADFKNSVEYGCRVLLFTKTVWLETIRKLDKDVDLSNVKYCISMGEQLNDAERSTINGFLHDHKCKCEILNLYGLSEANIAVALDGKTLPYVSAVVVDPVTKKELPFGQRGEIWIRNFSVMKEYANNNQATIDFFDRDNKNKIWFSTGDIGRIDKDGTLVPYGRAWECYKDKKGNELFSFELDQALNCYENKLRAIMAPNATGPALHVVLKNPSRDKKKDAEDIYKILKANNDLKIIPKQIKIRDNFPLIRGTKVNLRELREENEGFYIFE